LKRTPEGADIDICSDSQYVVKGITEWMADWKKKAWKNSAGKPVKNITLWQTLDILCSKRKVIWSWVRGHIGHPENEICDRLAVEACQSRVGMNEL
jgi:ribonuclease HI